MRKIHIYLNGKYIYTTERFKTLKAAINDLKTRKTVYIHSIPNFTITLKDNDKIKACFD